MLHLNSFAEMVLSHKKPSPGFSCVISKLTGLAVHGEKSWLLEKIYLLTVRQLESTVAKPMAEFGVLELATRSHKIPGVDSKEVDSVRLTAFGREMLLHSV